MRVPPTVLLLATGLTIGLAGCQTAPPAPAARLDPDMQRVLTAYRQSGARPLDQLSVEQARAQPTFHGAATRIALQSGLPADLPLPKVTEIQVTGVTGLLPARLYDPQRARTPSAPIILYFPDGGGVTGTLDTDDAACRALARATGAVVLAVQTRRGPEHRFPAAQDDANNIYRWLLANAASIGGDPRQIALAGQGAGGTLAIDTAIWVQSGALHVKDSPAPVHLLLIAPMVGTDRTTASDLATVGAVPLDPATLRWYRDNTTRRSAELKDPRLNVLSADLRGLPPTTIISAEIDPLRSENEALAQRLQAAGVTVQQRTIPGVTHGFFGMGAVIAQAGQAEAYAATRLTASFRPVIPAAAAQAPRRRASRPS